MTVLVDGDLKRGGLLIAIALILDFFDGFAARLFNEASELFLLVFYPALFFSN
jgi:phosphatidylserine synthase